MREGHAEIGDSVPSLQRTVGLVANSTDSSRSQSPVSTYESSMAQYRTMRSSFSETNTALYPSATAAAGMPFGTATKLNRAGQAGHETLCYGSGYYENDMITLGA